MADIGAGEGGAADVAGRFGGDALGVGCADSVAVPSSETQTELAREQPNGVTVLDVECGVPMPRGVSAGDTVSLTSVA
jgi:hypothetical protein